MSAEAEPRICRRRSGLAQALGPGIMYAAAAIGVSHLVQSTRAGAGYGFSLVWVVVLVHLFKYPFFEFAHRYAAGTGESLLVGYRNVGRWALVGFLVVAFLLSIPTAAVLTIVTAGMASQLFPFHLHPIGWALILQACAILMLATGGFAWLDRLMKVLMVVLVLGTLVAVVAAVLRGSSSAPEFESPAVWNVVGITFLVALMGWMPTPVDASVWPSLWMGKRAEQTGYRPALREVLIDFHVGYGGSLVMAVMFLALGALVMYGTGEKLDERAPNFAAQFVGMYTNALGGWSRPVIVMAAFIAMLSTLFTVFDGYPRVLSEGCRLVMGRTGKFSPGLYWAVMIAMMTGTLLIYAFLTSVMKPLVDATTILAFVSAPLFAYLNCRVVSGTDLPVEAAPARWLVVLSWAGLVFLVCFSILFLVVRFGFD